MVNNSNNPSSLVFFGELFWSRGFGAYQTNHKSKCNVASSKATCYIHTLAYRHTNTNTNTNTEAVEIVRQLANKPKYS